MLFFENYITKMKLKKAITSYKHINVLLKKTD